MLVNRRTFLVKKPHFDEALMLLAEYGKLAEQVDGTVTVRVYASEIGSFDTVACELETESLSAFDRSFAEFQEDPSVAARLPEWFKRWQEITEPGGTNEFWRLVD